MPRRAEVREVSTRINTSGINSITFEVVAPVNVPLTENVVREAIDEFYDRNRDKTKTVPIEAKIRALYDNYLNNLYERTFGYR